MKKFCRFTILIPIFCCILNASAYASTPLLQDFVATTAFETFESKDVSSYSDILEWVYKTENGKLYKRLYNKSSKNWVGDWIYVRDL